MPKLKTHQATSKRFKITKGKNGDKKLMKKVCGQDHFNAREPGKVTRNKRKEIQIANNFEKLFKKMLPYNY